MMKVSTPLILASAFLALGAAAPAQAALLKQVWVSGHGTDAASCGASTSPCRTFQYVVTNRVSAGGEIAVLDAGDYGPVTIAKPLSIINDSAGVATIRQTAADPAITVSVAATGKVSLRGLTLNGGGVSSNGILFNSGASLEIANCVARQFTNDGIRLMPSTPSTFSISDTDVSANGTAGIVIIPQGAAGITGFIEAVTATKNFVGGIFLGTQYTTASSTLEVVIVNSVAANNGYTGFETDAGNGQTAASMTLRNVVSSNNDTGVRFAGQHSTGWLTHSAIDGNKIGTSVYLGGKIYSYGDNSFSNNTVPHGGGAMTPVSPE